jgi:uncharacterized membrane protein HdeD (DUF308 family)
MMQEGWKWLIAAGVLLILAGLIWYLAGDKLSFLGKLPGDIRIERENFRFYFPITTMILLSILLNLIFRLIHWIFNH